MWIGAWSFWLGGECSKLKKAKRNRTGQCSLFFHKNGLIKNNGRNLEGGGEGEAKNERELLSQWERKRFGRQMESQHTANRVQRRDVKACSCQGQGTHRLEAGSYMQYRGSEGNQYAIDKFRYHEIRVVSKLLGWTNSHQLHYEILPDIQFPGTKLYECPNWNKF